MLFTMQHLLYNTPSCTTSSVVTCGTCAAAWLRQQTFKSSQLILADMRITFLQYILKVVLHDTMQVETQGQNGLQLLCHPQPSGLIF